MAFQPTMIEDTGSRSTLAMSYPLEKLESNVAQTWSSLEMLSQDFAQMWDQIEQLESIMSLQRQIISTVDEPSFDVPENEHFNVVHFKGSHEENSYLYNLPLTDSESNSWSEFFSMPLTEENNEDSLISHACSNLDEKDKEYFENDRNNLNKDIPVIRFQTYCDETECEKNIEKSTTESKLEYSGSENDLNTYDDQTFSYRTRDSDDSYKSKVYQSNESVYKSKSELQDIQSHRSFSESYDNKSEDYYFSPDDGIGKSSDLRLRSQSWLGLDNKREEFPRKYYSPQPQRKFPQASSYQRIPGKVGASCPVLDSSNPDMYFANYGFSKQKFPSENNYNPFLSDDRMSNYGAENLMASNFIVKPNELDDPIGVEDFDNIIDAFIQYHTEPASPESPPPPAPQDSHSDIYGDYRQSYFNDLNNDLYQRDKYDFYRMGNQYLDPELQQYEYVENIGSARIKKLPSSRSQMEDMELDNTDSETEDLISKVDYLYEREKFLSPHLNYQYKTSDLYSNYFNQNRVDTTEASHINDVNRLISEINTQENYLSTILTSEAYSKTWAPSDSKPYSSADPVRSAADIRSSLLHLLAEKEYLEEQYKRPTSTEYDRICKEQEYLYAVQNRIYDRRTEPFKDNGVPPTIEHAKIKPSEQFVERQPPRCENLEPQKMPSIYSVAGNREQYSTVYTSGVKYDLPRTRTPDLIVSDSKPSVSFQRVEREHPKPEVKPDVKMPPEKFDPVVRKRSESSASIHASQRDQSTRFWSSNVDVQQYGGRRFYESPQHKYSDKRKPHDKKGRRGTLRSAFSTVGNSVSHWIPNFHLAQRRHSFPTSETVKDLEEKSDTPKKKKTSIISMMTGIFHKTQKSSFHLSTSDSECEQWTHAYEGDTEDVFVENQYLNQYPDLTVSSMKGKALQRPEDENVPEKRRSTHEMPEQSSKETEDETEPIKEYDYEGAVTATASESSLVEMKLEEKPGEKYEYAKNPVISIDSVEENVEISEIEEDISDLREDLRYSPSRNKHLPKQFSLDVSANSQNLDDYKDDSKSNHSWCSTMSKTSSRRQSTEESIDTEDEWYMYEFRKLENLEKQTDTDKEICEIEIRESEMETVSEEVEDVKTEEEIEPEPKKEDKNYVLSVKEVNENISSGDTSGPDSPQGDENYFNEVEEKQPPIEEVEEEQISETELEKDTEQEPIQESFEIEISEQEQDQIIEQQDEKDQREQAAVEEQEKEQTPKENEDDEEKVVPGTPSLPRFQYDKSQESPHASKEEISKDGLGSKWKLVKALKERKAEEKTIKETEPPPPVVSCLNHCTVVYRSKINRCCLLLSANEIVFS